MSKKIIEFFILFLMLFFYRNWLAFSPLASRDWPYLFKETIQSLSWVPDPQFLWLGPYYQWSAKLFVQYLNLPWEFTERFWWFWMFLVISFFSSLFLSKVILKRSKFNILSVLIFLTNTYIIMIVGGGQMGVAMSYALAPAVLGIFINLFTTIDLRENSKFKIKNSKLILFSFLLAIQVMFDPRIAYITLIAILMYFLVSLILEKNYKKQIIHFFSYFVIVGIVTFIINSFWIIPALIGPKAVMGLELFGPGSLQFFSFANFGDALSLLHPNWPENVFGKTYFLKPEFLVLPVLAFGSLLFIRNSVSERTSNKNIIFFTLLGVLGIFLSKGVQAPFGFIYSFLFDRVPGFLLFRDPTKFYILIALSYSLLIPFILKKISDRLNMKSVNTSIIIIAIFLAYWIFLSRPALFRQLSGTFSFHKIPQNYVFLKDHLINDQSYSAVLWVPSRHEYTFYSNLHPFLEATQLLGTINSKTVKQVFNSQKTKDLLKKEKIRYVILDEDTQGVLFAKNRKYSEEEYKSILKSLQSISYLKQTIQIGKIVAFSPIW